MIKCEFVENTNKINVKENGSTAVEVSFVIIDDKAWVDVEYISDDKNNELHNGFDFMGNYFVFMGNILDEVKSALNAKGITVKKVLLGAVSEIRKLDKFSCEIDEEYIKKESKLTVSSKR